jgi:hypothetical protein
MNLKHLCTDPQERLPEDVPGIPNGMEWSAQSEYVMQEMLNTDNYIIEGVAVPRAIRKALQRGYSLNFDRLIILQDVFIQPSKGQMAMTKGNIKKVMDDVVALMAANQPEAIDKIEFLNLKETAQ